MPGEEVLQIEYDIDITHRNKMLKKGWPMMAFIENRLAGDPTNWFAPNHSCILAMLRTCGLNVVAKPAHEIYIVKPDSKLKAVAKGWNNSEYLSAIGLDYSKDLEAKVKRK